MNKDKKHQASVDGKEVEVEFIGADDDVGMKTESSEEEIFSSSSNGLSKWKIYLNLAIVAVVGICLMIFAINVFVWLLPIILPIALVILLMRAFR